MPTELKTGKHVTRLITSLVIKGKFVVAKMTEEGIYIKREKERWQTAYLVPWRAVYDVGGKLKAREIKEERAKRRKEKRGLTAA